ncbi:unnamed protein product [Dovyalis caffra]|uniref:Uncharacterized protein n=1 Tax=Dovyalis caffra TaxID=77055 RepID=A0AAV1R557_9ROSI|nr:unnamed protein product [Dovyalis caffra]
MASKNTNGSSLTQSKKFAFITKTKSNSFPRTLREESSTPNAHLKHTLSSPSLSFTYTSVNDLMPCVKGNMRSFSTCQSANEIAISNFLVPKAARAYSQPRLTTSTTSTTTSSRYYFWDHMWNKLKSPMNTCLRFINVNIVGKITHAFDVGRRAIYVV